MCHIPRSSCTWEMPSVADPRILNTVCLCQLHFEALRPLSGLCPSHTPHGAFSPAGPFSDFFPSLETSPAEALPRLPWKVTEGSLCDAHALSLAVQVGTRSRKAQQWQEKGGQASLPFAQGHPCPVEVRGAGPGREREL